MSTHASRSNGEIVRRNIAANLGMQANALIVSAVSVAIYMRVIGGVAYGLWLAVIGIISLGSMADVGIQYAVTQVVAELRGQNQEDAIDGVLTTGFWTISVVGVIAAIGIPWIVFEVRPFAESIRQLGISQDTVYWLITLGTASMVLQQAPKVIFAVEFGAERFGMVRLIQAGTAWIQLLGVLVLTIAGSIGVVGLLIWYMAWQLVSALIGVLWIAWRGTSHIGGFRGVNRVCLRVLAHKGAAFFGTTLANTARSGLDAVVISSVLGTAWAARYGPSMRIFTLGAIVVPIVFEALWPTLVRIAQGSESSWVNDAFRLGASIALGVGAVVCVLMVTEGQSILNRWVGASGDPGAVVITVLCVWFMINLWVQAIAYVHIGLGRTTLVMWWTLAEGVGNIGASIVLMEHIGLLGNAIASAGASLLFAAIPLTIALRRNASGRIEIPARLLFSVSGVIVLSCAVGDAASRVWLGSLGILGMFGLAIVTALVTLSGLMLLAVPAMDRSMLVAQLQGVLPNTRKEGSGWGRR